jgi:hypothetical protein
MKALSSIKRNRPEGLSALKKGTLVRVAIPLRLPDTIDGSQLSPQHAMTLGWQREPIPLLMSGEVRDIKIGAVWFAADRVATLSFTGVIQAGSNSANIVNSIATHQPTWVRPLVMHRCGGSAHALSHCAKRKPRTSITDWWVGAFTLADTSRLGWWPFATDTAVELWETGTDLTRLY